MRRRRVLFTVLVVPRADRMPLATLRELVELARGGATIVFDGLPSDVPGYGSLAQRRREFLAGRFRFSGFIRRRTAAGFDEE
jgi:hypothetical protein